MNTTTLNMTTLDDGRIIKKGGGGATINNQDKVVDITENGTTEVVADSGFTGLGKVTINTEVSGSAEGGGSNMEYLDLRGVEAGQLRNFLVAFAANLNVEITEGGLAGAKMAGLTWGFLDIMFDTAINPNWAKAISIDLTTNIIQEQDGQPMVMTIREMITALGVNPADIDAIPRLTKEQFYTLE